MLMSLLILLQLGFINRIFTSDSQKPNTLHYNKDTVPYFLKQQKLGMLTYCLHKIIEKDHSLDEIQYYTQSSITVSCQQT